VGGLGGQVEYNCPQFPLSRTFIIRGRWNPLAINFPEIKEEVESPAV